MIEKFEAKVRRRAQRLTAARTHRTIPLNKIHEDPLSCDAYQRLMEVILRAARDWKPDGGMTMEAWIGFRLAHTDADSSFFEGPLTVPYGAAHDYIAAAGSSWDVNEQRADWESRGRDPLDFDTIASGQSFDQPTLPGDWSIFHDDTELDHDEAPCARPSTEALAEARLFLTNDLTEVEQMVWLYHDLHGYTFEKIGRDLLPAHLFDSSGDVKHKVRRIYLKAKAKAEDFRNIDGSAL